MIYPQEFLLLNNIYLRYDKEIWQTDLSVYLENIAEIRFQNDLFLPCPEALM